jgi:hypothetical protein
MDGRIPWEHPDVAFPANIGLTWWDSLTKPEAFFRSVNWDGPLARPVLYWLLVWIVAGLLSLLWDPAELESLSVALLGEEGAIDGRLLQLLSFFLTPFVALAALALATVLHHAAALMLAPDRRGVEATARVVCYASGPMVLASLPVPWVLGWFWSAAVWAWTVVLLIYGFREAHRAATGRAAGIVLLPAVVVGVFFVFLALALAAVLASLPELPV